MKFESLLLSALPLLFCGFSGVGHAAEPGLVAARQKFFGAENVDPTTGAVKRDKIVFSWATNTTLAVSIEGRVVLLDTYIHRLELPPKPHTADLRRSPIDVQDFLDLRPEAIFLGHGHGDHADNAAYVAKKLGIPIYASAETCAVMQADVQRMYNDPNTANGGVKIVPDNKPVKCNPVVTRGSVPGTEVVHIAQLEPLACIVAFKHIHSGPAPTDKDFPFVPVANLGDPRDADLYPELTPVTPPKAPAKAVPGQMDLTTLGKIPGSDGGAIAMYYEFVLRGGNNFSFTWHNSTGPLKEGLGMDPGLPSSAVGAHLFQVMDSLPQSDLEFGSAVSIGYTTNGVRDVVMYNQHIKPQIYFPMHFTNVPGVPLGTSLAFKQAYLKTLDAENAAYRPEVRWLVDPGDFLKPMVFSPNDERWRNPGKADRIRQFCK